MSLLYLALLPTLLYQPLPTMEDVRKSIYEDARRLKGFSEDVEVIGLGGEVSRMSRWVDGARWREEMVTSGTKDISAGSDGKIEWFIFYSKRGYWTQKVKTDYFNAPYQKDATEVEEGTFEYSMSSGYDFKLRISPEPVVKSFGLSEWNGRKVRELTADLTKKSGNKAKLTIHLLPDRWVICHILLAAKTADGKPLRIEVTSKNQAFDQKIDDGVFHLDESEVVGFDKLPIALFKNPS